MKRTRLFQLTVLLLVIVAAVQVGYWIYDQHQRGVESTAALTRLYDQQSAAARTLIAAGSPLASVRAVFPDLYVNANQAMLAPEHQAELLGDQQRRITQYLWEGGFFLFILLACIGVIFAALRAETRVLNEQEQFLALVSHQFKTPLASLQLSLETMNLRELPPERSRTLMERMFSDLARMAAMVGQILDSSRLSHGRMELKSEPVALDAAVHRIMAEVNNLVKPPSALRDPQIANRVTALMAASA